MEKDFKIFGDKNFSDLSQEIYENSKLKKTQIDLLIQEVHGYIQGIEDIAVVGPILKELLDVGVKNDDNLLKLATVFQRIMMKSGKDESDIGLLSDDEKQQLMDSLEDAASDIQKKPDETSIDKIIECVSRITSIIKPFSGAFAIKAFWSGKKRIPPSAPTATMNKIILSRCWRGLVIAR